MDPPLSRSKPPKREAATDMEVAAPEGDTEAMCSLQMMAIPVRVGTKAPSNLNKAGAPMDLYAPFTLAIPPLGASRVYLDLHIQLPAKTESVLQTRQNFQRRGLTITNPQLRADRELTMLITNNSHTKQWVSQGACVDQAVLHHAVKESAAHHGSRPDVLRSLTPRRGGCGSRHTDCHFLEHAMLRDCR